MVLAARWGGGCTPADLRFCTIRDLHVMASVCDQRDAAEQNARNRK